MVLLLLMEYTKNQYTGKVWLMRTRLIQSKPDYFFILHMNNDIVYYYITKQESKPHKQKYRWFINDWRRSGLKVPTYIMLKNLLNIANKTDFKSNSYIIQRKDKNLGLINQSISAIDKHD